MGDYEACLQRGIKLMKMMETGEKIPPTPFKKVERIEKNGWTEISTNKLVQPSINSLIWGEECKKVFKFSYHENKQSSEKDSPVGLNLLSYNVDAGIIILLMTQKSGPLLLGDSGSSKQASKSLPLTRPSDHAFLVHKNLCKGKLGHLKKLEWFVHDDMDGGDTEAVTEQVLEKKTGNEESENKKSKNKKSKNKKSKNKKSKNKKSENEESENEESESGKWPGIVLERADEDQLLEAVVGTPHGWIVAYLLAQHRGDDQYGAKIIDKAHIFYNGEGKLCLAFHIVSV